MTKALKMLFGTLFWHSVKRTLAIATFGRVCTFSHSPRPGHPEWVESVELGIVTCGVALLSLRVDYA